MSQVLRSDAVPLPPEGFTPRPSQDDALTLFAQTICHRLGVARAFISLLDGDKQFILAEARPDIPFRQQEENQEEKEESDKQSQPLWLGNVCIPRHRGFCRASLAIEQRLSPLVIPDLAAHPQYKDAWCVEGYPYWRFYAAYPLYGSQDAIVGDVCVFDHKARPDGVTVAETKFLDGISGTITKYLETLRVHRDQVRHERMINGLLSFDHGSSDPSALTSHVAEPSHGDQFSDSDVLDAADAPSHEPLGANLLAQQRPSVEVQASSISDQVEKTRHQDPYSNDEREPGGEAQGRTSSTGPSPDSTTISSQASFADKRTATFRRAASILRQACDVDGVAFIDASVAATGIDRHGNGRGVQASGRAEPAFQFDGLNDEDRSRKLSNASINGWSESGCRVIASSVGYPTATKNNPCIDGITSLSSAWLRKIVQQYPRGQAFEFVPDSPISGTTTQDTDEENDGRVLVYSEEKAQQLGPAEVSKASIGQEVRKLGRNVQNFILLPLWNYDSMKWCACAVLWTEHAQADSFDSIDFKYLQTFGNSIMLEQSRLYAVEVDRMKTSFVASISHELRTPLHGLLGAAELMKNTAVDLFQSSMLDIIQNSGNTLLDVLEHVLDYSKITRPETSVAANGGLELADSRSSESSHKQIIENHAPEDGSVDGINIAQVTEEVIDSVVGGRARNTSTHHANGEKRYVRDSDSSEVALERHDSICSVRANGDQVQLVLQIDPLIDEAVRLAVGSWRRIVMNLVSNALKYTRSGHILICLEPVASPDRIRLSVEDTGVGMSESFMTDGARNAFTQEDPFAPGLGLGLHITQQLVTSLNGVMNIRSAKGVGTKVTVEIGVPNPSVSTAVAHSEVCDQAKQRLNGRAICLLHHTQATDPYPDRSDNDESFEVNAIQATIRDWFDAEPKVKESLDEGSEIVFCIRLTAEEIYGAIIARPKSAQQLIILASVANTADAFLLQQDARLAQSGSILMTLLHP